jgi:phosphohistidine phosphatase SixA|tara:strand:- start:507 stop:1088 length:582 start_codon:yes stop_codon:yes gene_type:complete
MRNNFVPRLILSIILSLILFNVEANEANWKPAQEGNKVILIRHALAPGTGDPPGFKLYDCSTQRNLNQVGIDQSKKIGELFKKNEVIIHKVLSSQWCRCKDTAKYAFGNYKEFSALNSTFRSSDVEKAKRQITKLKNFVKNWNGNGGNLILMTHYVIISAVTDAEPRSGEIVITDKNFKVLSTIKSLNYINEK